MYLLCTRFFVKIFMPWVSGNLVTRVTRLVDFSKLVEKVAQIRDFLGCFDKCHLWSKKLLRLFLGNIRKIGLFLFQHLVTVLRSLIIPRYEPWHRIDRTRRLSSKSRPNETGSKFHRPGMSADPVWAWPTPSGILEAGSGNERRIFRLGHLSHLFHSFQFKWRLHLIG